MRQPFVGYTHPFVVTLLADLGQRSPGPSEPFPAFGRDERLCAGMDDDHGCIGLNGQADSTLDRR